MAEDDTQIDTGIPDFNGTDVSELTDDITEVVDDDIAVDEIDPLLPLDDEEEKVDEEDPFGDMETILDPNETNTWDDR